MATFYNNEVTVGATLSGIASTPWVPATTPVSAAQTVLVYFSGGTVNSDARIAFNSTANPLTTAAPYIATFANTQGTSIASGTGRVTFNRSLSGQSVYLILPDRTSFVGTLPSSTTTMTLANNGYEAWSLNEVRLRNMGYF